VNKDLENLYTLAKKESRVILGVMSGISLDGVDFALCHIKGSGKNTEISILEFETIPYTSLFRDEIKTIFAKEEVSLRKVCLMNAKIAITHAEMINDLLNKWGMSFKQVDLIASHGQTIFHAPRKVNRSIEHPNSTLQIGDGDHISVLTGIITISDFRQKHIAAGGQGAPLVAYGDYLLFSHANENRILLNIGGISNFTFLPSKDTIENLISTDVGPGNTLLNQYMLHYFNLPYDRNGIKAATGKSNFALLNALAKHRFFEQSYPKTTGPEEFNLDYLKQAQKDTNTQSLNHEDVLATLIDLTVSGIAKAVRAIVPPHTVLSIYVSGGGINNSFLMKKLKEELSEFRIESTTLLDIPPDAKEAVLFALLANETVAGKPIHFPAHTGAPAICMGKVSLPR
jgi:anhydro-N-acetylmuramic acid kinase